MAGTAAALLVEGLVKRYKGGITALDGVDLRVEPGEVFAILGPNGAGKSTLINIVAQITTATAGAVAVFGTALQQDPLATKRLVGITPQEIALDPFFTVREVLVNHAGYYGFRDASAHVERLLERLGLAEHAHKRTRQLSGGMKRRLTVAKSLVHQPPLIILDEPTAGVDVALRRDLWAFVSELHQEGVTVILTTHYLEEAQALAGRVAIINHGRVVRCAPMSQLLNSFGGRRAAIQWQGGVAKPAQLPVGMQWDVAGEALSGTVDEQALPQLLAWAAEHGHGVRDLRLEPPRLEDVYLQLTAEG
ncbi:ABC transporter related protein [Magnetococcus marinus MC-1]|uniref:ABC transporter related protein n=1 Tax=Magnetococcus marinus (strain ATCC BAA-1437 / JCM 17883 / MC-1) TaxID=156889 RepID=A0L9Z6_MAGMM|nr:ABC transporter ATP-binding protein [Magnetococcus marinus]ABK44789.1 ABC transporter related protein [Magnetococcus marinus MC-1]